MNILTRIYTTCFDLIGSWFFFHRKKKLITILGSARFPQDHPYCEMAYKVSQGLVQKGYTLLTGSGLGIMEAASRGAMERNGIALGCYVKNIESVNPYLSKKMGFYSLAARQKALIEQADMIIIFPGGFGTLAELLNSLVLIQNKYKTRSLFLMGQTFWEPLMQYFKQTLLENKTIDADDLNSIYITDSVEDVLRQGK